MQPTQPIQTAALQLTGTGAIDEIINAFIEAQDVKTNSKALYKRTLKLFFSWVSASGYAIRDLTRVQILQYKDSLLNSGMSGLTVGSYLVSIRRFYEWVEANRYGFNIAKGIKTPTRKQQFRKQALTPGQGRDLLKHFEADKLNARDLAIINLLLRTGLRTIEVIRANVEDIVYKGETRVLLVHGKGRNEKDDFVILTDKTYQPIKAYLDTRPKAKTGEPLFNSVSNNNRGQRLTTRTISKVVKEGLKSIGLDNRAFTAHSLRHTAAVNILRATNDISQTQAVLRHASPATTQIYTATIKEEMRLHNAPEKHLDNVF